VSRLDPLIWGVIVLLVALLLATIGDVTRALWQARRRGAPPYDWALDDELLDEWARDEEGEVLTVIPASWRYR
jgi:hypothetical protein